MGDRQTVEALQWLACIGQTRDDIINAVNGREVHLPWVPNVKVHGYSPKTKEIFEYLGCFWVGCPCMSNRHKPIGTTEGTLLTRYEETKTRLQKIKNAGYTVVSIWGASLENCCEKIRSLKMNLVCTLIWRTLHLIFGTPCTGVEPRPQNILQSQAGGENQLCGCISLYPYICEYGKFPVGHPKVYVVADCPPDCLDGRGLSNVRFYLPGNCIIQYFRTNAIPNWCSLCVLLVPARWTKAAVHTLMRSAV